MENLAYFLRDYLACIDGNELASRIQKSAELFVRTEAPSQVFGVIREARCAMNNSEDYVKLEFAECGFQSTRWFDAITRIALELSDEADRTYPTECRRCQDSLLGLSDTGICPKCQQAFDKLENIAHTYGEIAPVDLGLDSSVNIDSISASNTVNCPLCAYDLTGLNRVGRCPECGEYFSRRRLIWEQFGPEAFATEFVEPEERHRVVDHRPQVTIQRILLMALTIGGVVIIWILTNGVLASLWYVFLWVVVARICDSYLIRRSQPREPV